MFERVIIGVRRRGGNLVGSHHGDVAREQFPVAGGGFLARRAVHKNGVEDIHLADFLHHLLHSAGHGALFQFVEARGGVDALTREEAVRTAAHAHEIEFEPALAHQGLAAVGNLLQERAAHGARAAEEEVEFLVLAQEKAVVQHVERFSQLRALHHEREVHFQCAECHGGDADTVAAEHAEQFSGNARRLLHPFAHSCHARHAREHLRRVHCAVGNLAGKLVVEQLAGAGRVGGRHTDRGARFRGRLRHHKHADAAVGQCGEDAAVHANHAHHRRTAHRHHAHIVYGRYAADGAFRLRRVFRDDRAVGLGVEGVFYENGDILPAHGVNRGRIYHLRAEVAQFHGFAITEAGDGVGGGNDARVGRHEAVHVGPYFQSCGVERGGDNGGGVVGAAASEVGGDAFLRVFGDEAARHGDALEVLECFAHEAVRLVEVHDVLAALPARLDKGAGVEVLCPVDERRHDERREAFAVCHYGIGRLGREFADEIHAVEDALQLCQQLLRLFQEPWPARGGNDLGDVVAMARADIFKARLRGFGVARCRRLGKVDQGVCHATQGRHHRNGGPLAPFHNLLYVENALGRADRRTSEFENAHNGILYL